MTTTEEAFQQFFTRKTTLDFGDPATFLGKGFGWPLREDPETEDIARAEGVALLREDPRHLIQISVGEIPGLETMGTNYEGLLFTNQYVEQAGLFAFTVKRAIEQFEPRADYVDLQIDVPEDGTRELSLRLFVKITSSGRVSTFTYPLYVLADPQEF